MYYIKIDRETKDEMRKQKVEYLELYYRDVKIKIAELQDLKTDINEVLMKRV